MSLNCSDDQGVSSLGKRGVECLDQELDQSEAAGGKRQCDPENSDHFRQDDVDSSSDSDESIINENVSEDDQGLRVEHIDSEECAFLYQVDMGTCNDKTHN
jgi:hypothetical protein